jgi:hypothetical protein
MCAVLVSGISQNAGPISQTINIDVPVKEAQRRFINRMANRVQAIILSLDPSRCDLLMAKVETTLGEPHFGGVQGPTSFMDILRKHIAMDFSRCLFAVEGLYNACTEMSDLRARNLGTAVTETMKQSEVDLGISWQDGLFLKRARNC